MSIIQEEAKKEIDSLSAEILHIIEDSIDLNNDVRVRADLIPMILWHIKSEYSNYEIEVNIKVKSENQSSTPKEGQEGTALQTRKDLGIELD